MAISLKNKRNTRIETGDMIVKLWHHGHNTCIVDFKTMTVTIDTCGYDTLTTRGKINKFLDAYGIHNLGLARRNGVTMLSRRHRCNDDVTFSYDVFMGRDIIPI